MVPAAVEDDGTTFLWNTGGTRTLRHTIIS